MISPTSGSYSQRFASNAPANGVTVYELARIMGTSVGMIQAHGALLDTAYYAILERLEGVARGAP
jgi:hypothetical protein